MEVLPRPRASVSVPRLVNRRRRAARLSGDDDEEVVSNLLITLELNGTRNAEVRLDFDSGAFFVDATQDLDWITAQELLNFSSSDAGVISVSESGTFTLHDNHYERVRLSTTLACGLPCGGGALSSSLSVAANLAAGVNDVDLGSLTGVQFTQSGDTLDVGVYATTQSGHNLVGFQIMIDPLDNSVLTSGCATSGSPCASFTAGFSGASASLNSPPTIAQVSGGSLTSTSSGSNILLGTLRPVVVGSGVPLLQGKIVVLTTCETGFNCNDASNRNSPDETPIAAGQGYASLTSSGRRRRLSDAESLPLNALPTQEERATLRARRVSAVAAA